MAIERNPKSVVLKTNNCSSLNMNPDIRSTGFIQMLLLGLEQYS